MSWLKPLILPFKSWRKEKISQILENVAEEEMLVDKTYRKLFIQAVCVKALWVIAKIKEISPDTKLLVILEEPTLGTLGEIKRENEEI